MVYSVADSGLIPMYDMCGETMRLGLARNNFPYVTETTITGYGGDPNRGKETGSLNNKDFLLCYPDLLIVGLVATDGSRALTDLVGSSYYLA